MDEITTYFVSDVVQKFLALANYSSLNLWT